jgi:hypothetical protein
MESDYGEHLIHALELVQRDIDATAEEPHRMHFVSLPSGSDASDDRISGDRGRLLLVGRIFLL